jgi:hypothetical protein
MMNMKKMMNLPVKKLVIILVAGVSLLEQLHVVQNHNPQRDNLGSNFVGLTSHLALYYDPPLGPFSEYVGIFVQFILF